MGSGTEIEGREAEAGPTLRARAAATEETAGEAWQGPSRNARMRRSQKSSAAFKDCHDIIACQDINRSSAVQE